MEIHKIAEELELTKLKITQILKSSGVEDEAYHKALKAMKELDEAFKSYEVKHKRLKNRTIGVVMRDITEVFFHPFIKTIEHQADALGYGVVFVRKHNLEKQKINYIKLLDEKVDGFIFLGEDTSRLYEVEQLQKAKIPCVIIQGKKQIEGVTYLNVDNIDASYAAMTHLAKQGHKRIIHITGPMYLYEVIQRSKGYEKAVKDYNLDYHHKVHVEMEYEKVYDLGCELSDSLKHQRITAAYCYNNLIATGLIDGLMDQGVVVPKDFSVVGFDDLSFRHLSRNWIPRLSSVKQPQEEMASYAVDRIIDMIENDLYDASETFKCQFVDRDSVRMI